MIVQFPPEYVQQQNVAGGGTPSGFGMTSKQFGNENVCGVIVTYNPDCSITDNVLALLPQVAMVFVVDNGSSESSLAYLSELHTFDNVTLIRNGANLGIAAAFNIGVRKAGEAGCRWVATFDQDSRVPAGFIALLLATLEQCPFKDQVALIAPLLQDPVTGLSGSHGSKGERVPFEEVPVTISSGCLLRYEAFERAGLFDEALFIDYVDHEYCLRLRSAGFRLIESKSAVLEHRIGATTRHAILGMPVKVTNHLPLRRYYMTRNRLLLYWRYGRHFPVWAVNDCFCMLKELVGIVLFEEQKMEKLAMMLLGFVHCLTGRRGQLLSGGGVGVGSAQP